jgi:glycosyltransferase involved in cell wall biosynthesis
MLAESLDLPDRRVIDSTYPVSAIETDRISHTALPDRHLLIFELGYTGHYPSYIGHLARYWLEHTLPGRLSIVVSRKFAQHHPDVLEIAANSPQQNLNFITIKPDEEASLLPRRSIVSRARRSIQEWKLLRSYATELRATHCLLLYFDSFQSAVLTRATLPCPFSGIYFRPTFHYSTLTNYSPSIKERIQSFRERLILPFVFRHPQLCNLFCLDPFVITHLDQLSDKINAIYLPDPVPLIKVSENRIQHFRTSLGIEAGRRVFLLFGALYDKRKGLQKILAALSMLPAELRQKCCLLLVGQTLGDPSTQNYIAEIHQFVPVQVIVRDTFVPESEVLLYFQSADAVLSLYQRHIGMSGILVLAAAAQKPVLSSDYGLLGELTRYWKLGMTVDSADPVEISKGLTRFLEEDLNTLSDRVHMKAFAKQNSAENYAQVIFQYL